MEQIKKVTDYGVLNKYIGKEFSRKEIDKIIAEMILKHPYIDNSKFIELSIMRKTAEFKSFYHTLNFRNYNYKNQVKGDTTIKYELD